MQICLSVPPLSIGVTEAKDVGWEKPRGSKCMDRSDLERYDQPVEKLQQWLKELWAANQTEKNERTEEHGRVQET